MDFFKKAEFKIFGVALLLSLFVGSLFIIEVFKWSSVKSFELTALILMISSNIFLWFILILIGYWLLKKNKTENYKFFTIYIIVLLGWFLISFNLIGKKLERFNSTFTDKASSYSLFCEMQYIPLFGGDFMVSARNYCYHSLPNGGACLRDPSEASIGSCLADKSRLRKVSLCNTFSNEEIRSNCEEDLKQWP